MQLIFLVREGEWLKPQGFCPRLFLSGGYWFPRLVRPGFNLHQMVPSATTSVFTTLIVKLNGMEIRIMKIKHEHIRDALFAWARAADGRKVPANAIADAYFALGMTGLLYSDDHPNAQGNNIQKIYRWAESDSLASQRKMQALLPAIEKAMPVFLLARMRSHSSETCRDLVLRKERIDREMEAMIGAIIALSDRVDGSGPAGNVLAH